MCSFVQQVRDELDRDRGTNIVSVWFECEAPDSNTFFAQNPERFSNGFQEALLLHPVYSLHFLQQIKWNTESFADRDECRNVFGKTGAAVSDPSIQKITADAMVHANSVRDFFDISAACLANHRNRIDI